MNLHEYQAKQLFSAAGVTIPDGSPVFSLAEARAAAEALGGERWVVKAQLHAGGRGKAGGVVVTEGLAALEQVAERLLGSSLVTPQTGPAGLPVQALLIERPLAIMRELYLSLMVDRSRQRVRLLASAAGGMNIEEVAATQPEQLHSVWVDPVAGLQPYQCRQLAFALQLEGGQIRALERLLFALYRLFLHNDATLIEINPLVVSAVDELVALDAKMALDDNALFRHPELQAMRDLTQEDQREAQAREHDLNYVTLDGTIGCMVNGAGLAMATMDLVQRKGGRPANFLDVGGGATAARVAEAFKLILSDSKVRAVLVNIFGGIVRCDLIAEGIVQAVREVGVAVPVVVRLEGTNAEQGLALLAASGLAITPAADFSSAAELAVQAAQSGVVQEQQI